MDSAALPNIDEQERILAETKNAIKRFAFQMRKAIDEDNMREALKFAATMLGDLRTSYLSPQKYYELYMLVFDQLGHLEAFFGDEQSKGRKYSELYELVQHAGNVLPRLYLMTLVGCLYIKSGEVSPRVILKDLVELCKGVQHPTRGLFLRAYLCQRSRALLPQAAAPASSWSHEGATEGVAAEESKKEAEAGNSSKEDAGETSEMALNEPPAPEFIEEDGPGTIHDSLDFLLSNFVEMNKLWVRMQYQGSTRDREKRERERQQLQDLVGKNLTYLSQLDGLDFTLYSGLVLPRVIEQVVSCKDDIAQQYLVQALIQGFPDAFHLGSLEALLGALPELQPGVKIHTLMASLMTRLAKYANSDKSALSTLIDMDAFDKFLSAVAAVVERQTSMPAADVIEMYVALLQYAADVHPGDIGRVNRVLAATYAALSPKGMVADTRAERQLVALLTVPLTKYDVVTGLALSEFPALMGLLSHATNKELAVKVVQGVVTGGAAVANTERVDMLFKFISPLVVAPQEDEIDEEDLEEEQVLVARLVHHLVADDPDTHRAILASTRQHLEKGGARRLKHTLPALVFCTLQLVRRLVSEPARDPAPTTTPTALMQWLLETCGLLSTSSPPQPMTALRLLLSCAAVASDEVGDEMLAYQFFEEAFELYETYVSDARARVTALQAFISTLHRCYVFGPENRDSLVGSVSAYCSRLLHRADQCRAICAASHLSWQDPLPTPSTTQGPSPSTEDKSGVEPDIKQEPELAESGSQPGSVPVRSANSQPAVRDGSKVLGCLKKALKIANAYKQQLTASARQAKDASYVGLYVEILNHYLYYFDHEVDMFTPNVVAQLAEVVAEEAKGAAATLPEQVAAFLENTRKHIAAKKAASETAQKYTSLTL